MEWVVTNGRTLDEARDLALDQLGVEESELEVEILEEPRPGLFGRVRGEYRVRARIQPKAPRPKPERRSSARGKSNDKRPVQRDRERKRPSADGGERRESESAERDRPAKARPAAKGAGSGRGRSSGSQKASEARGSRAKDDNTAGDDMQAPVSLEEQATKGREFLEGLVDAFGYDADVEAVTIDDDNAELRITGDDLGLLIGPKGQTLTAIQELTRLVVNRQGVGHEGRIHVDVSGYRQRRREALARFAEDAANAVLESGRARALEPMSPADRKVVHDTINEIDGVTTSSEGFEGERRVVISPA